MIEWLKVAGPLGGHGSDRQLLDADLQSSGRPLELVVANTAHMKAVPGERAMFRMLSGSLTCCAMGFFVPASFLPGSKGTCGS